MRFITLRGVVTPAGRMVAALMVGLLLLLVIGGASPKVHDHVCAHHHGDVAGDHCAINAFAAGEGYSPPVPVSVTPLPATVEAVLSAEVRTEVPSAKFDLPPACGPPVAALNPS